MLEPGVGGKMIRSALWILATAVLAATAFPAQAMVPARENEFPMSAEAKARLRAEAESGNFLAREKMGELNSDWAGEVPDYVEAARWFDLAHNPGQADYYRGFIAEHARLYQQAQSGDAKALYDFAHHTPHNATGLAGDEPMPHWLLLAAQAGSVDAQSEIGQLYFRAAYVRHTGVHDDAEAARERYLSSWRNITDAAWSGEPLGFDGESAATDLPNAILWLNKAAQAGNAEAAYALGLSYAVAGPTQDVAKARLWFNRVLEKTPAAPATACLLDFSGQLSMMEDDDGMFIALNDKADYPAALTCYGALQDSNPDAVFMMGYMAHHGLGTPRDDNRALALLGKARHGDDDVEAKYELGRLYLDSKAFPHDPVRAYIFLSEALDDLEKANEHCVGLPFPPRHVPPTGSLMSTATDEQTALYKTLTKGQRNAADIYLRHEGIASHNPGPPTWPMPLTPCV